MPAETLKSHLPGVEPERRLNDWGRSERVEGVMDATLIEFFYKHWFRAEVEGIENVPASGGALLVSNHSGALPPDAAMIGKAIREEHSRPRALNITVEHFFKGYPGFSMLTSKIGCVPAHPANVHRLLFDEEGMHEDKAMVQTVAHEVRARIQENLWDMVAKRRSVWFG